MSHLTAWDLKRMSVSFSDRARVAVGIRCGRLCKTALAEYGLMTMAGLSSILRSARWVTHQSILIPFVRRYLRCVDGAIDRWWKLRQDNDAKQVIEDSTGLGTSSKDIDA
jgi:hypothetical protein